MIVLPSRLIRSAPRGTLISFTRATALISPSLMRISASVLGSPPEPSISVAPSSAIIPFPGDVHAAASARAPSAAAALQRLTAWDLPTCDRGESASGGHASAGSAWTARWPPQRTLPDGRWKPARGSHRFQDHERAAGAPPANGRSHHGSAPASDRPNRLATPALCLTPRLLFRLRALGLLLPLLRGLLCGLLFLCLRLRRFLLFLRRRPLRPGRRHPLIHRRSVQRRRHRFGGWLRREHRLH